MWPRSGCGSGGRSPPHRSFVAEHGLSHRSSCTWLPRGTWTLPGSGTEPVPPALVGRFQTARAPGKAGFAHTTVQKHPKELSGQLSGWSGPPLHCLLRLDPEAPAGQTLLCSPLYVESQAQGRFMLSVCRMVITITWVKH